MTTVYVDANVIVSRYKPGDPYHGGSERILTSRGIRKVSSDLTLVELASVVSRLHPTGDIVLSPEAEGATKGLSLTERILAIVGYVVHENPIEYYSFPSAEPLSVDGAVLSLLVDRLRAYMFAPVLGLKTLDNLHVAALSNVVLRGDVDVNYFVTCDGEMIEKRGRVKELTGVAVVDPDTLVEVEMG